MINYSNPATPLFLLACSMDLTVKRSFGKKPADAAEKDKTMWHVWSWSYFVRRNIVTNHELLDQMTVYRVVLIVQYMASIPFWSPMPRLLFRVSP
jgi:hypothetical protein